MNSKRRSATPVGTGLGGLAVGAALSYLFDPQRGARRRADLKQGAVHAVRQASGAVEMGARDLAHRTRGIAAEVSHRVADARAQARGETVDDAVLADRVRSKLGRVCSHASAIRVSSLNGRVELVGPVLQGEAPSMLRAIKRVRGVREIDDDLHRFQSGEHVPALQGEGRLATGQAWAPSSRTLVGLAGFGLLGWGISRKSIVRSVLGLGLLLRSTTNLSTRRLLGIGAGRRAIDLRKDVHVKAPVAEVFAFFAQFENFPRFMSHVREVVHLGDQDGRWRWTVTGPAGLKVTWEAQETYHVENQLIAWESVEGSVVENLGSIRFEPSAGGTRLSIRISYNPPGGAIGHALVTALGANPRRQLDDDLVRFKSLIETGKTTGSQKTVTREALAAQPHP